MFVCELQEFDTRFGCGWQCVVGSSFGCFFTHSQGTFIYFTLETLNFLIFKGASSPPSSPFWKSHVLVSPCKTWMVEKKFTSFSCLFFESFLHVKAKTCVKGKSQRKRAKATSLMVWSVKGSCSVHFVHNYIWMNECLIQYIFSSPDQSFLLFLFNLVHTLIMVPLSQVPGRKKRK